MTYEICFLRSEILDRQVFKAGGLLDGQDTEGLIVQKLACSGIKALPKLQDWSCPIVDEECGQYEITARFSTCLPMVEAERLFRQALAHGLSGDIRVRVSPGALKQLASAN